jgi:hypothetical protein
MGLGEIDSGKGKTMTTRRISRRTVLGGAASAAMAFHAVPRHVLGGPGKTAPSDKLSVACIGVGGKGSSDSAGMASENVLALCDADARKMGGARKRYPQAKVFHDYREMLTQLGDQLDVVTVSTPDHRGRPRRQPRDRHRQEDPLGRSQDVLHQPPRGPQTRPPRVSQGLDALAPPRPLAASQRQLKENT